MRKITDINEKISQELEYRYGLIVKYSWRYYRSEENVRSEIIEPILKVLGWEIPNIEREYDNIDFALAKNRRLFTIIEAKSLKGRENNNQLINYLNKKYRPNIAILTNGLEWQIIRLFGESTIRCYKTVSLENHSDSDTLSFFNLLLYEKIENIDSEAPKDNDVGLWTQSKKFKEKSFRIDNLIDDTKSIIGSNMKDVFVTFIKQLDRWNELYENLLVFPVVMKENELPSNRYDSSYPHGKGQYYINTDNSTFDKRVAIAQIIYLFGLDDTYKIVIENDHP